MTGVAWLIPYCARPASTPSTPARNDQSCVRDARAREAAWPPPARSWCAMREHGGLAWPPRHPALRQTRLLLSEAFTLTIFGSAFSCFCSLLATPAAGPDFSGERLQPFRQFQVF